MIYVICFKRLTRWYFLRDYKGYWSSETSTFADVYWLDVMEGPPFVVVTVQDEISTDETFL